jgi:hypothetical protein
MAALFPAVEADMGAAPSTERSFHPIYRTADAMKTVAAASMVGERSEIKGAEGGQSNPVSSQLVGRIAGDVVGNGGSTTAAVQQTRWGHQIRHASSTGRGWRRLRNAVERGGGWAGTVARRISLAWRRYPTEPPVTERPPCT